MYKLISRDLPLEKLLQLSKSLKTGVEQNLNKFKVVFIIDDTFYTIRFLNNFVGIFFVFLSLGRQN